MSMLSRICLCLGACLLVAGFAGPATGTPGPEPGPGGGGSWPYCGAEKDCSFNNRPGYYCTYAAGPTYWVCITIDFPATCTPGGGWFSTTCSGLTPAGLPCSTTYTNCSS